MITLIRASRHLGEPERLVQTRGQVDLDPIGATSWSIHNKGPVHGPANPSAR